MATFDLPQGILMEIFLWLPAKSVGKCRCLSKSWRTRLSTSEFIKSHLARTSDQESIIIETSSFTTYSIKGDGVSRKLEFRHKFYMVLGSCNGLVLLLNHKHEMFLVNPVTLQQVKIPVSPLTLARVIDANTHGLGYANTHGLGYDRYSDDYKVVQISYLGSDNESEPDCVDTFVEVYSVKRGTWKRVHNTPYDHSILELDDHSIPELYPGAFVNGAIHWLVSGCPYVITAFNLVDEMFDEFPVLVDAGGIEFNGLVVLGGCLCVFGARRSYSQMDFWIMKEYGVRECWTKFSIHAHYQRLFAKPLLFIGDEDLVLRGFGESLVVYNLKERTLRPLRGFDDRVLDGTIFVESLVSPALSGKLM